MYLYSWDWKSSASIYRSEAEESILGLECDSLGIFKKLFKENVKSCCSVKDYGYLKARLQLFPNNSKDLFSRKFAGY